MSFQIRPVSDIPEDNVTLLGHDSIVNNLKIFLEHQNMITPLSIAIHGEWGSGKTSIMRTLAKKLDRNKYEVMFFEAWKYEYANPSLGLISEIAETFSDNTDLVKYILRLAVHILTKEYLGLDVENIVRIIKDSKSTTDNLTKSLHEIISKKIGDKKLIIIIDDLDRCDVENTLQLLAIIKLFLDFPNCICLAAVDFNRLKQAWQKKYKIDEKSPKDGSEYLDKIFQIRIGIPRPTPTQLQDYLKTLVIHMPDKAVNLFSLTLPKNPRSIKRTLNLVSYRQYLLTSHYKEFSAIFWTLLEDIVTNERIIFMNDRLVKSGSSISHLIVNVGNWDSVKDVIQRFVGGNIVQDHASKLEEFFQHSHKITEEFKITEDIIAKDFAILYSATNEAMK